MKFTNHETYFIARLEKAKELERQKQQELERQRQQQILMEQQLQGNSKFHYH